MKFLSFLIALFSLVINYSFAQSLKSSSKFKFFNRTELNYAFGINETFANEKLNVFQIKTIFGKQNNRLGTGIGIATGTYRTMSSGGGAQFNTISFSANFHAVVAELSEAGNNIFVKGSIGYAPKIFNGYDKGLNYDGGLGYLLRTRKGGRFFGSIIYHHQDFENFRGSSNTINTNAVGLGIGTWF